MKKVGKQSITMRWLINSLGVIFIILLVIEISLIAVVKNYYYTSARQYISGKMTTTAKALIDTLLKITLIHFPLIYEALLKTLRTRIKLS